MEWGKKTFRIYFLHLVIAFGSKSHPVQHHMSGLSFIQLDSMALNLMRGVI